MSLREKILVHGLYLRFMDTRRLVLGILIVGLIFVVNQLYVDALWRVGIGVYFDWLGAMHILPFGVYYVAVGGMYLFAGGLSFWIGSGRELAFQHLALGVGVSLFVVLIGMLTVVMGPIETMSDQRIAATLGTGPVLIGFLIGAAPTRSTTRTMWLVATILLAPFFVLQVVRGMGLPGGWWIITYVQIVALVILDTIWAYPLYRLGRALEGSIRSKPTAVDEYIRRVTSR